MKIQEYFNDISAQGKFGFGFMRLPVNDKEIDTETLNGMVDAFMKAGFNYFDTAHGYMDQNSEAAIKTCLTSRYPRESFVLTNKLSGGFYKNEQDIRPLFEKQLNNCGVDYFDFYLLHALTAREYETVLARRSFETVIALKNEGKIKHIGISFHDTADVLEKILMAWPQIEIVQIQLNYVDWEDPVTQSRLVYEVCRKFNKPVLIMEPCKGGNLINLPPEAMSILQNSGKSPAEYALRFAASLENVVMVLSGMSTLQQVEENTRIMKDDTPFSDDECQTVNKLRAALLKQPLIPCTACRYCTSECPRQILIPDLFSCYNQKNVFHNWNTDFYYGAVYTSEGHRAKDCVHCGRCEAVCPQKLPIRQLLVDVSKEFDHPERQD